MKTKLFTALALLAVGITAFVFKSSPENNTITPPPAPIDNDQFLITVADVGLDYGYAHLSDLHLNAWHKYTDANPRTDPYPNGWIGVTNDWFDEEPDNYRPQIEEIIRKNKSEDFKLSSIMDRPKTAYTLLAQRSDYQAEREGKLADHDLGFYTYRVSIDDPGLGITDVPDNTFGGGAMVKQCIVNTQDPESNADYILSGLKSNHEQANKFATSQSQGDHFQKWHVMPRIRIPTGTPNNTQVCKIEIYDWDGLNPIIEKTIMSENFKDENGNYDGRYLEEFFFDAPPSLPKAIEIPIGDICPGNPKYFQNWYEDPAMDPIKTDFRVYWFGACNMWIDYVRVENEPAHQLFKGQWDLFLQKEVVMAAYEHESSEYILNNFYREEFEFNCLPCIRYVNNLINTYAQQQYGLDLQVMCNLNYELLNVHRPDFGLPGYSGFTTAQLTKFLCTGTGGLKKIVNVSYPLEGWKVTDPLSQRFGDNSGMQAPPNPNASLHPPTLYSGPYDELSGVLSDKAVNIDKYEDWLQDRLDFGSGSGGGFMKVMKLTDALSKSVPDLKLVNLPQAHLYWSQYHKLKEPSNEEERLLVNLAISYGAKGIMYFSYAHKGEYFDNEYYRGLTGLVHPDPLQGPFTPRILSVYNQNKWQNIEDINPILNSWGPTLMSFDNINRHSYSFRLENERTDLLMHSYFMDVVSYVRGWDLPDCWEDAPDTTGDNPPEDIRYECNEDRYLQVATFLTVPDDGNKYFMIVNRRCSPYIDESSEDYRGGKRYIRIKFDQNSNDFPTYSTWKITDIARAGWELNFLNNYTGYLDLGWFMPGEGRLYKISAVFPSGGTLLADENIEGVNFTCEDTVYNNGHSITIGANTTIHFTDSSTIVMDGGTFTMGNSQISGSQSITSDAVTGNSWHGYSFNNCEVRIYGAAFSSLANDTTYALNIIDCPVVDIRNSTFSTNASLKGGINGVYYSTSTIDNIYIGGNTFTSTGSSLPQVQVMSYAGITTPLIIENNTFNYGSTAILLSGVTGEAIKDNDITGYSIGINLLTSSVDVADNSIVSSHADAIGIFGASGSEIKMNNSGGERLGGANDISTTGRESNNMKVDNSYFLIDEGENIFNINETDAYHLSGFFNPFVSVTTSATENCFKFSSSPTDPPYQNVTWGDQGSPVSFTFSPYLTGCEPEGCEDPVIVDLGGGIYDTICGDGGGQGGGESSSIENYELGITNSKNQIRSGFTLQTPKQMYDSLSILMRHRNYPQAKVKCYDILNTYPDSLQGIYTISKLFLATIGSDTTTNTAQQLKTYYEGLILNHPTNTALVTRANYFIQKCKVRLRDYNSALTGFSQIINQNPYSYEALVARWDYMAASLLIEGQGGGESSINNYELGITNDDPSDKSDEFDKSDELWGDKSPYTKQERQDIRKSINTALENTGRNDERKMKILEESGRKGDKNAMKELNQRKTIKEVVKTERPRTIIEHTRIVAGDIRKVFGAGNSGRNGLSGNIPTVFRLSQNYPNPFNPATKINYDLPRDAKVNIVIYDILGREVKRLLNNDFRTAGSYVVDFNASNYASGVYFYRIEAEESNGNKFVDSKKMVLLK